tara:strand:- start:670 stop:1878 length:1209 start_codon:yes stop_codon:yes gene_type:complete
MSNQSQNQGDDKTTFIGWEPQTEEVDFFGTATEVQTLVEEGTTEKENKEDEKPANLNEGSEEGKKKPIEEPNVEDDNFFGITEESAESTTSLGDEGNKGRGEEEEEEDVIIGGNMGALAVLKDKGILDYELEEGEELNEEMAATIIEDNFEASVEDKVGELFEELPQVVKDLNKFVLNGGDIKQFLGSLVQSPTNKLKANLDLSVEADQEAVVRASLVAEEYDEDYINTHIDFLKDSKKLESFAKAKHTKMEKDKDVQTQALAANQTKINNQRKTQLRQAKVDLSSNLQDLEDVNGLPLDKVDKKELPTYMVDRNVKLENGGSITTMQKDLMEALKDENKALFIAKLLRNDFDLTALQAKATTKVVKKVKDGIRRNKKDSKNVTSTDKATTSASKKSLSDYF